MPEPTMSLTSLAPALSSFYKELTNAEVPKELAHELTATFARGFANNSHSNPGGCRITV